MKHIPIYSREQIDRLREAIEHYRGEYRVGDSRLAYELLQDLSENVSYDATVKNIQRLRKGENIRGQTFLKAAMARY